MFADTPKLTGKTFHVTVILHNLSSSSLCNVLGLHLSAQSVYHLFDQFSVERMNNRKLENSFFNWICACFFLFSQGVS